MEANFDCGIRESGVGDRAASAARGASSSPTPAARTTAAIQSDGSFSVSFATKTLAAGSYAISYSFAGGGVFLPASGSGALQVTYNPVRIVLPLGGTTPRKNTLQLAFQLLDDVLHADGHRQRDVLSLRRAYAGQKQQNRQDHAHPDPHGYESYLCRSSPIKVHGSA